MKFQPLTYSGKKCNNYLYFCFYAEDFAPNQISEALNMQPTSIKIKNDPVPKHTSWNFKINIGNELDLESPLKKLVDKLEPKIRTINDLKERYSLCTILQFVIDIDINPEASTPFFGLNKRTIKFLNLTETEVDFDLYKVDSIGIINDK